MTVGGESEKSDERTEEIVDAGQVAVMLSLRSLWARLVLGGARARELTCAQLSPRRNQPSRRVGGMIAPVPSSGSRPDHPRRLSNSRISVSSCSPRDKLAGEVPPTAGKANDLNRVV